jgi:hypothetical protein
VKQKFSSKVNAILDLCEKFKQDSNSPYSPKKLKPRNLDKKLVVRKWHMIGYDICKVLPKKDHATCGKERFINPDCRAVTLFRFRVRQLG